MKYSGHLTLRSSILSAVLGRKKRWLFAVATLLFVPVLEGVAFSCLFFIVDGEKQAQLINKISSFLPFLEGFFLSTQGNHSLLFFIFGLTVLCSYVSLRYINEYNVIRLSTDLYIDQSRELVRRYLYSEYKTTRNLGKERITNVLARDSESLSMLTFHACYVFGALARMFVYSIASLFISWKVFLVAILVYAVPALLTRRFYKRMIDVGKLKVDTQERVLGYFDDLFSGFLRIKVDGLENKLLSRTANVLRKSQGWKIKKWKTQGSTMAITDGLAFSGFMAIGYFGIEVIQLELSLFFILFLIFGRIKSAYDVISGSYFKFRELIPLSQSYIDLMNEFGPVSPRLLEAGEQEVEIESVEFDQVSFEYKKGKQVLDAMSFRAESGDRILIKGESGQGKTTFLNLLIGLLEPTQGVVKINGRKLSYEEFFRVRGKMAVASPNVNLFQGSLLEHLELSSSADEDLEKVIRQSGLEKFVASNPQGMETDLGRDGGSLSLGQKQRAVFARVFLKQRNLFILDEATSNLDEETERQVIQSFLNHIDPNAIVIVVAHKVPPLISFNHTFEMKNGKLISS